MMELYAKITQKVYIDPIDVINRLIENEIGNGYLSDENGKYFIRFERSEDVEIPKEFFDYVEALYYIHKHIKTHNVH